MRLVRRKSRRPETLEKCGHQPAVIVWDASDGSCLAQLKAHKYGISCVKFSPNGKHLLSAGFPHDGQLCVFDIKSGTLISKARSSLASSPISGISFASDGSFFVTAGSNQFKQWIVTSHASRQRSVGASLASHTLEFRNVNLGSLSESSFVAVVSSEQLKDSEGTNGILQPIYGLATAGKLNESILCSLHRGLAVKKWVNLKVQQGNSLCLSGSSIACACSNGVVRIFTTETLTYVATLPRPAPLGFHDLTDANTCGYLAGHNVNGISYPDAVACCFATPAKLVVIYGDHSLFIWDVENFSTIHRCQSYLSHSECIWDIISLPDQVYQDNDTRHECGSTRGFEGQSKFATCSSDGSIRLWCIEFVEDGVSSSSKVNGNIMNVYDKSLSGVLYQDKQGEPDMKSTAVNQADSMDSSRGFRSLSASYDGHFLAAGDRRGNLHIYDLNSLQLFNFKEAHDAEILTLSFGRVAVEAADNKREEVVLLASGGRDRLVHIYNASRDFEVIETLDDHSASVTALKFSRDGSRLLSASADKSVVFRKIEHDCMDIKSSRYHQEIASRGTVYDLDIDISKKLAVAVGQDKKLNFLSLSSGKSVKSFKPEGDSGEPIKVKIDPSGTCLVCSHSDKSLRIYDVSNGELLSLGQGHSEVITGVIFTPDCKRLISISGDSCVFVWKLPTSVSKMMRKKCHHQSFHPRSESGGRKDVMSSMTEAQTPFYGTDIEIAEAVAGTLHAKSGVPSAFKFSISRLPHWAQAKVSQATVEADGDNTNDQTLHSSDSRWAERLGAEGYKLFCEPEVPIPPATVIPNNRAIRRRFTIEPSASSAYSTPESSLDSELSGTSSFSPCVSGRKPSHWKTVHTLFFDEDEYIEDDAVSDIPTDKDKETSDSLHAIKVDQEEPEIVCVNSITMDQQHPPMSIISMLSQRKCADWFIAEREPSSFCAQVPAPAARMMNLRRERAEFNSPGLTQSGSFDYREEIHSSETSSRNDGLERQGQENQLIIPKAVETSDEDESEAPLSPDRGLFHSHFGNLSTAIKAQAGQASARSSFSARYFAQSCHPLPVISLFQDSPQLEAKQEVEGKSPSLGDGLFSVTPLSKEREMLKVKELQEQVSAVADTEELGAVGVAQRVLSTVKEQGPSAVSGASTADGQADNDQCCLDLIAINYLILADDSIVMGDSKVTSNVSPMSLEDDACAMLQPQLHAQKNVPSIPCDLLARAEIDAGNKVVMDGLCSALGEAQDAVLLEGRKGGVRLIEEDKCMDATMGVLGTMTSNSSNVSGTLIDLKRALQDISQAVDKALASFRELELTNGTEGNGAMVTTLASLHEEFIPPTLQKVWLLSDGMTALHQKTQVPSACERQHSLEYSKSSYSDQGSLRLSNTGTLPAFATFLVGSGLY
ncbi:hypothetical protein L7F22_066571 [Adiantum nelumboides]|nr:hypothetical protein [Adiantum nelumboides]